MSRNIFWISLILTSIFLGTACWLKGIWFYTLVLAIPTLMMGISLVIAWSWISSIGLIFFMIACVTGLLFDLMPVLILAGATTAIISWDLVRFQRRIYAVKPEVLSPILEKEHLKRLLLVSVPGFVIPVIALQIKFQPSFGIIIGMVLILAVSLSYVTRVIKKEKIGHSNL